jgi:DUF1680 family protein
LAAHTGDEQLCKLRGHVIENLVEAQTPEGYLGVFEPEKRTIMLWDVHEQAYPDFAKTPEERRETGHIRCF